MAPKEELADYLDQNVEDGRLTELHSHLMGMGSDDFWFTGIMRGYLPRKERSIASASSVLVEVLSRSKPLWTGRSSRMPRTSARFSQYLQSNGVIFTPRLNKFLADANVELTPKLADLNMTSEVVYSVEDLCTAFFPEDIALPPNTGQSNPSQQTITSVFKSADGQPEEFAFPVNVPRRAVSRLFSALRAADVWSTEEAGVPLFLVFDALSGKLDVVPGFKNSDIVRPFLDTESPSTTGARTFEALLRNAFSMLTSEGKKPRNNDIACYRGRFEPEFYPRRFCLRDAIVKQQPEVLSILMNQVCYRYAKGGVTHVELSVSVNDMLSPVFWKHCVQGSFSEGLKGFAKPRARGKKENKQKDTIHQPLPVVKNEVTDGGEDPLSLPAAKKRKTASQSKDTSQISDAPVLAKLKDCNKPAWRAHYHYHDHPRKMKIYFIAAFNRGKIANRFRERGLPEDFAFTKALTQGNVALEDKIADSEYLENLFPSVFHKGDVGRLHECGVLQRLQAIVLSEPSSASKKLWHAKVRAWWIQFCVGFDLVGDELDRPVSPFLHKKFLQVIQKLTNWSTVYEERTHCRFGVRLHAGENVPRSFLFANDNEQIFMTHLRVIYFTLKRLSTIEKLRLRIGHGVAFLHEARRDNAEDPSGLSLQVMREWIKNMNIPVEVNLCSNAILLADTCCDEAFGNGDVLRKMLEHNMPVVLCTDDDGIWPIQKCSSHYYHVSVAGEFCRAIQTGQFTEKAQIEAAIVRAREGAFVAYQC